MFTCMMCVCVLSLLVVSDSVAPWTIAQQILLSMEFSGRNNGVVAISSSKGIPNAGIKPMSLVSSALAGGFFATSTTWEANIHGAIRNKNAKVLITYMQVGSQKVCFGFLL